MLPMLDIKTCSNLESNVWKFLENFMSVIATMVTMAKTRELPDEERAIIKNLSLQGLSLREISRIVSCHYSTISRVLKKFKMKELCRNQERVADQKCLIIEVSEWLPELQNVTVVVCDGKVIAETWKYYRTSCFKERRQCLERKGSHSSSNMTMHPLPKFTCVSVISVYCHGQHRAPTST